jgi:hypothetical protein
MVVLVFFGDFFVDFSKPRLLHICWISRLAPGAPSSEKIFGQSRLNFHKLIIDLPLKKSHIYRVMEED